MENLLKPAKTIYKMESKLSELEQFLGKLVDNYPVLPKATNLEERLDKAAAYGALLSDYRLQASSKIKQLFADNMPGDYQTQIQKIANDCLRSYHRRQSI